MDVKKDIIVEDIGENTEVTRVNESENELSDTIDTKKIIKKILIGVVFTFFGYLLGGAEIFFGALPFGIALLSAASKNIVYIYIGLCLSAIIGGENITVFICAYTITVLIRILSRIVIDNAPVKNAGEKMNIGDIFPILFGEHICLRMATSAIGAFIIGIFTLIKGGFYYYDLFGAIIGMLAAPVAVAVYYGCVGEKKMSEKWGFLSVCGLSASLIFAARDLKILGVPLAMCAAMLITLWFCRKKSLVFGIIIGAAMGLAYSPVLAPIFVFAALSAVALWKISGFFACLAAASVSIAWGFFTEGIDALTSVVPAVILSCLIFSVVDKLYIEGVRETKKKDDVFEVASKTRTVCTPLGEEVISSVILDDTEQKVKVMCETFNDLSALFYKLSERMRNPASSDIKQICDSAFDSFCQGCEMRESCWEKEYSASLSTLNKLSSELVQSGHITESDVPERMRERCQNMPSIVEQINRNCMLHTQQLIIGDKTEIFALDYEAISELLAGAMVDQREEFEAIPKLSEELCERLSEAGIEVDGAIIYGNQRRKNVIIRAENASAVFSNLDLIADKIESVCGERLELSKKRCEGGCAEVVFTSVRRFYVEYAKRSLKAEGEEGFCGDTINIFENGEDKFYSFLSDGMGSGRDAALTSSICSVFLSKILTTTSKCDISLRMLNGFLRNKGSGSMHECSATVDLMEFDLITGAAAFYKGGAAPSYVYRDTNLFKLRSNSVPLGIIKELDTRKISFELGEGDIVVMVSDGVTQSRDECPWLFDLLRANVGKESLASISDMIVKRAKYEGAVDDISVIVMKICR